MTGTMQQSRASSHVRTIVRLGLALAILSVFLCQGSSASADTKASTVSPQQAKAFFARRGKAVLTFVGYSGAGYEDAERMLEEARNVLSVHSPRKTIVNIGATVDGIGQVYAVAKHMGFETTGIVSTQAKKYGAELSPHADRVFYIEDESWGGFLDGTKKLSPTSDAMVACSDVVVAIGGGAVGRDEMVAARKRGKTIKFIPADMKHKTAIEKARKKGEPIPTDFRGDIHRAFGAPSDGKR